jgi:hypothetical protein
MVELHGIRERVHTPFYDSVLLAPSGFLLTWSECTRFEEPESVAITWRGLKLFPHRTRPDQWYGEVVYSRRWLEDRKLKQDQVWGSPTFEVQVDLERDGLWSAYFDMALVGIPYMGYKTYDTPQKALNEALRRARQDVRQAARRVRGRNKIVCNQLQLMLEYLRRPAVRNRLFTNF